MIASISRTLTDKSGSTITVTLTMPEPFSAEEWCCVFTIDSVRYKAHGLDAFQSLIMAIEGIRTELSRRSSQQLTWAGGELGEPGFPRFVPQSFGLDFSRKIDQIIDNEIGLTENAKKSCKRE